MILPVPVSADNERADLTRLASPQMNRAFAGGGGPGNALARSQNDGNRRRDTWFFGQTTSSDNVTAGCAFVAAGSGRGSVKNWSSDRQSVAALTVLAIAGAAAAVAEVPRFGTVKPTVTASPCAFAKNGQKAARVAVAGGKVIGGKVIGGEPGLAVAGCADGWWRSRGA